ncbi:GntR family transcriptional regulator [Microbulbifer sp. TYP-18]|uniref:GntR family transcriptional regulator n=1 Tax=Microbulbifer sp. TYP-18 TaxID=3230024 RepID=UPI0034C69EB4
MRYNCGSELGASQTRKRVACSFVAVINHNSMLELLAKRTADHLRLAPRSPKYLCLRDAIVQMISEGLLSEGDRIPTEQQLAAALPVSLGTVQKALNNLVETGDLYRQRRRGTFVAESERRHQLGYPIFSFFRPDNTMVQLTFVKLLKRERVQKSGPWSDRLGSCAEGYVHLVRRDRIDGVFNCHTELYLRADTAEQLMQVDSTVLEQESILPLLQTLHSEQKFQAQNQVGCVRLPRPIREVIDTEMPEESWGIRLETLYQLTSGSTVVWQVMHIPINEYRLNFLVAHA